MGETPRHWKNMASVTYTLDDWFAADPQVYVASNMFIYYVPGDRLRHVAPDVFVVRGIPKVQSPERRRYLVWEEGKGPDLAIEVTSASTREEDLDDKFQIYQDTLKVQEYFLYDPFAEYLKPPLQGYRLLKGRYERIKPVKGRLPSKVLGLHLENGRGLLRLYDPAAGKWLPTPQEAREQAEIARQQAEAAHRQAEAAHWQAEAARQQAETEISRLQQELEALRRKLSQQ
jgi:Uma2 family endonuclease